MGPYVNGAQSGVGFMLDKCVNHCTVSSVQKILIFKVMAKCIYGVLKYISKVRMIFFSHNFINFSVSSY